MSNPSQATHHDLVIRSGTVIDGTRALRFESDVAVRHGRISAMGDLSSHTGSQEISAQGLVVAPGFIDSHTHDDQALISQPLMPFKISQGVTSVVVGNCGISAAPLFPEMDLPMPLNLLGVAANERFTSFSEYLNALRSSPASVNVAAMVGHSTLRALTMSSLDREATPQEIKIMRKRVEEAMQAGAFGVSTGTFYPPAACATTTEIIEICRPLTAYQGLYATHMRDESEHIMQSLEETFSIGRELDIKVIISHHKLLKKPNFGKSTITLPHIRHAMRSQRICLDCYPYAAGSTMIRADNGMLDGKVLIAESEPHPECAGREIHEIAAEWGISAEEAAHRLQPGSAVYFLMDENDVQRIMAFEETMIGSDGIPTGARPHPRLWGTFPRVLGRYSRDIGLFPLETAVWKMTGLTAANFGLDDRGTLAVGKFADIVIFNPETVIDTADYSDPSRPAAGIEWVLVNGEVSWRDGAHTGARNGQVLTHA